MENVNEQHSSAPTAIRQIDVSSRPEQPTVYTLSAEKLSRNQEKMERRKFKNRITDRRSLLRQSANGEPQVDRRKANRVAYARMHNRLRKPQ